LTSHEPVFGIATALTEYTIAPDLLGRWLEEHDFESVWFGEHSHMPVQLTSERRSYKEVPEAFTEMYDPLVALASVAAATKTLKLGTSVLLVTETSSDQAGEDAVDPRSDIGRARDRRRRRRMERRGNG
jgi:hypothetical protein